MILNHCIEILYNIFMVEVLNEADFFSNRFDLLLTDGHFFHGHNYTIIEIDSLID